MSRTAWGVNGSGIGEYGGGELEHPRQRLGAQWAGLSAWECRAAQDRQARHGEAPAPNPNRAQGGRLSMLAGVHRLVQVLDPLLDGREVLSLGELDEVGRLAHRDLGDHLQRGGGEGEGDGSEGSSREGGGGEGGVVRAMEAKARVGAGIWRRSWR